MRYETFGEVVEKTCKAERAGVWVPRPGDDVGGPKDKVENKRFRKIRCCSVRKPRVIVIIIRAGDGFPTRTLLRRNELQRKQRI